MTKNQRQSANIIMWCFLGCFVVLLINFLAGESKIEFARIRSSPISLEMVGVEPDGMKAIVRGSPNFFVKRFKVTAYCPCKICCGKWADGMTASGLPAEGWLVAASKEYPFGTMFSIPGYAYGLPVPVLDRGVCGDNHLDVFFPTHEEALQWGVKYLDVKVYREK